MRPPYWGAPHLRFRKHRLSIVDRPRRECQSRRESEPVANMTCEEAGNTSIAPTTAVVIDADPLWRLAVTHELTRSNVSVVAGSAHIGDAPELAEEHAPDLLLLGVDGEVDSRALCRLLRRIQRASPDVVTVVCLDPGDRMAVDAALAGGAFRAVDRRLGTRELMRAVADAHLERARLTRRELEILRLVAQGRSNREVAKHLWATEQTMRFHLANACRKLGVRNRVEASRCAFTHGLVDPHDEPDAEPGLGVREPRRPIKPSLIGGIALHQPEVPDEDGTDQDAAPRQAA